MFCLLAVSFFFCYPGSTNKILILQISCILKAVSFCRHKTDTYQEYRSKKSAMILDNLSKPTYAQF